MSVLSVQETTNDREGEAQTLGKRYRKHKRSFLIKCSSRYDGSYTVLAALPTPGSAHPDDASAIAYKARAIQNAKTKCYWTATVEYTTERNTPTQTASDNPLNDPAEIEWNTDITQENFTKDKSGNAILTSAGNHYVEPIKDDVSYWTVSISKNVSAVPSWIDSYRDAVNSDNIVIDGYSVAAGTAKIKAIKISKWQQSNDIWFKVLTLSIKIKADWRHYPLDQDLYCKGILSSARVPCMDSNKKPVTKPVPLDGSGNQLANPTPSTVVFNTVDLRNTQPFSLLPLY